MSEVQVCTACGRLHAYPMPVCRGCGGGQIHACTVPFTAEIYSHTRISRAPTPALQAEVPYSAVLVRGMSGGLLLLRWSAAGEPAIGEIVLVQEYAGTLVAQRMQTENVA